MESLGFKVADLFCGAGGLSLGFKAAGFELVRAFEWDNAAIETYKTNLGEHVVKKDLSQPVLLPAVAVVIGGPPCQGFSSAGMRKPGDARNSLVSHFAEHIV